MVDTDIELGMRVRDTISGFTGIVTTIGDHISGCTRIGVDAENVGETSRNEGEFFFPDQLEIVDGETDYTTVDSITECEFELGQEVRDEVTDFTGAIVIINYSLYNCPSLCVQSMSDAEQSEWFDDLRVNAITEGSIHEFERLESRPMSTETGPVGEDRAPQNLQQ